MFHYLICIRNLYKGVKRPPIGGGGGGGGVCVVCVCVWGGL